uniref:HMG box domain-containing protein n=1 Tax=Panagrolaimus davidi TaxID=227884 RepID=A0A914QYU6_9BILA
MQPFIRKEMPNATFGMLSKLIASKWDTLDEKHKKEYRRRSAKAKRDKLRELAMFKVNQLCSTTTTKPLPSYNSFPLQQQQQSSQTFYNNIYQQKKSN